MHIDPDGGADHLPRLCDCTTECRGIPPRCDPATHGRGYLAVLGAALAGSTAGIALGIVLMKL
jgi:hypothetical protein